MTSIIIASNMIVVAFDTLLLILFLYLAIAAIRLVFRKNYKGAAKLGGLVALAVVLALIADMPNLYIFYIKSARFHTFLYYLTAKILRKLVITKYFSLFRYIISEFKQN